MIVYKATNRINGKGYIGITIQPLPARMRSHKQAAKSGSTTAFAGAIRKYGWDAFTWEVLGQHAAMDALRAAECAAIREHNTFVDGGRGYNRTTGGEGAPGLNMTAEQRFRLSTGIRTSQAKRHGIKRQRRLFHNLIGHVPSAETRAKRSASMKRRPLEAFYRKLPLDLLPTIKARKESGESYRALGAALGVRPETVFYFLKRAAARA